MPSYKNIVVGTDGSPGADRAVTDAAELARAAGAKLTVVSSYVREDSGFPLEQDSWHDTTAGLAEDHVFSGREVAAHIGVESAGLTMPAARPGPGLVQAAEDENADLVVVGSRGMTGAKRFILGSVPDHVAHHAPCDVLIVRSGD